MTGAKQRRKGKERVKELSQQVKIFEQLLRNGVNKAAVIGSK